MKKAYQQPTMNVVSVEIERMIAGSGEVQTIQSNGTGLRGGGASSNNEGGIIRVKGNSVDWDDWGE